MLTECRERKNCFKKNKIVLKIKLYKIKNFYVLKVFYVIVIMIQKYKVMLIKILRRFYSNPYI